MMLKAKKKKMDNWNAVSGTRVAPPLEKDSLSL